LKRASFEFLGWLPLGVVGKGPCQVVEGDGGGPEGAGPIERSYTPSGKGIVKPSFTGNSLKISSL